MINAQDGFKHAKESGDKAEDIVLRIIRKQFPGAYRITGYAPGFDIAIPETKETLEVKQDKKSFYSGDFVVEIAFNGHRSGLSVTKADYWVFVDYEHLYFITPNQIWLLLKTLKLPVRSFTSKGDDKMKMVYFVSRESLMPYCKRIIKYEE